MPRSLVPGGKHLNEAAWRPAARRCTYQARRHFRQARSCSRQEALLPARRRSCQPGGAPASQEALLSAMRCASQEANAPTRRHSCQPGGAPTRQEVLLPARNRSCQPGGAPTSQEALPPARWCTRQQALLQGQEAHLPGGSPITYRPLE